MRKLRLFGYHPSIVHPHKYPVISQWILQSLSLSAFRIVILHCYFCHTESPEQNFQPCMFFSISFSSTIEKSKEVFLIFYLCLAYQMLNWQDLYIYIFIWRTILFSGRWKTKLMRSYVFLSTGMKTLLCSNYFNQQNC